MKRQAFAAIVLVWMWSGCSGSKKDIDIADGGVACDPDTQTGCKAGEKCASLLVSEDPTIVTRTACVQAGSVAAGGACVTGAAGETTGFDDCIAGYHCLNDVCTEICSRSGTTDTCANTATQNCVQFDDLFDDITDSFVGLCTLACNPVTQDCPIATQGCFLNLTTSEASCADIPNGALAKRQDDACFGPMAGRCYLNGCPKGYGALLPNANANPTTAVCAGFCNPVNTHTGAAGSPQGSAAGIDCNEAFGDPNRPDNAGGGYQCRFIQSFYNDAEAVAITTGFCVNTTVWGDCTTCDITNATTFDMTCAMSSTFGCVDFAMLSAIPATFQANGTTTIADVVGKHQAAARVFGIERDALPGYSYGMSLGK